MLLTETGYALVEHLERQKDVPSLLASFQKLVLGFGMDSFCVGDPSHPRMKRPARRWHGTWRESWWQRYAELNFFRDDPTVLRMNASPVPFRWTDNCVHATSGQKRMVAAMQEVGVREGLAVPVHGPYGVIAGVSIASGDHYDLSPGDERALHMASLYLHSKMQALRAEVPSRPLRKLTPRERECLKWVAAGKTDWEISQILSISEQTVHGYVQNALTKLNARTRAQAVALAMLSAQILQ
ncbi:MAG TPA: LuxR family transcriptional regulator [Rhizomicrobium sp.]|nr:LuxR family transcriptional regulator [Rhizomicrobium sp.]